MRKWNTINDFLETVSESMHKVALLNTLKAEGPKKLEDLYGSDVSYPNITADIIDLEESGILCRTTRNEIGLSRFGMLLVSDMRDITRKFNSDTELRGIAGRTKHG